MSLKDNKGAWVIPQDQLDEFMLGPINYKELIANCLQPRIEMKIVEQPTKKKKSKSKTFTLNIF